MLRVSGEQIRLQLPPKLFGVNSWMPQMIRPLWDCWLAEVNLYYGLYDSCVSAMRLTRSVMLMHRFAMSDALASVYNYELTPNHVPTRSIAKQKYVTIGPNQEQVHFALPSYQ